MDNKLKQTIKIVWVSAIVFIVISLIAVGVMWGLVTSNAIDNLKIVPEEAKEMALEYSYIYARDHYGYTDSMEAIATESHDFDTRELVVQLPFRKCHYVYEFDFTVGDIEMEISVNAKTGMCSITDMDRVLD